jgi:hypothetical protein
LAELAELEQKHDSFIQMSACKNWQMDAVLRQRKQTSKIQYGLERQDKLLNRRAGHFLDRLLCGANSFVTQGVGGVANIHLQRKAKTVLDISTDVLKNKWMLYYDNENIDEPLLFLKKEVPHSDSELNNFGAYNINTPNPHSLSVTDRFLSGAFSFVT